MENDHEDDRHVCAAGAIDTGRNLYCSGWWNRRGVRNANQSAAGALTQLTAIRSRLRFGERSNRPTGRAFSRTSRATPRPLRLPQRMRKTGRYGRGRISSSVHCWSCQAIESQEGVLRCVNCYLSAWWPPRHSLHLALHQHRLAAGTAMDMALTVTLTIDPLSIDPRIPTDRTIGHASLTAASIAHACGAGVAGVGEVLVGAVGGAGSDRHS